MKKTTYSALGETVYRETLPNGLPVIVVQKPGFSKKCAYFAVDYGALHMNYQVNGAAYQSPAGVAHYLEHKMFDLPDEDAMDAFVALGANPNAFTSYDMTAYYFSCTENFGDCLKLLLRMVSTPYFTEQTVEKERGIIAQEIGMYEDSVDSAVYEDLFAAMYQNHPLRIPVAGTVDSIGEITAETLYDCHRAFYNPANMVLCVVGDVDPEAVSELAREILPESSEPKPIPDFGEPEEISCGPKETYREMDAAMPAFQIGFKCPPPETGLAGMEQELLGDLTAEALMGESSPLYQRLYEQGLIDSSFGAGFETFPGAALLSCGGDSENPRAVMEAILEEAKRIDREGIDETLFSRLRKSALGRRIRELDSFDSLCGRICACTLDGADYFDFPACCAEVTKAQAEAFLREHIRRETCVMSVIAPRGWKERNS